VAVQVEVGSTRRRGRPRRAAGEEAPVTELHASAAGSPQLVLDLGRNAGGYVEVGVTATDGTPVQLGYAEREQLLTPLGDTCGCGAVGLSRGTDDEPAARFDVIRATGPTAFRSPGIRGAQRWVAMQLTGPGTVRLDYVRGETHLRPADGDDAGWFRSSDPVLDRPGTPAPPCRIDVSPTVGPSPRPVRRIVLPGRPLPGSPSAGSPPRSSSVRSVAGDPSAAGQAGMVVTDGAKRDRMIWAGDLVIEDQVGAYSHPDAPAIAARSLVALACGQRADGSIPPTTPIATTCADPAATPVGPAPGSPSAATASVGARLHRRLVIVARPPSRHRRGRPRRPVAAGRPPGDGLLRRADRDGLFVTPTGALNWHPPDDAAGP
jgi:hypothetical protein